MLKNRLKGYAIRATEALRLRWYCRPQTYLYGVTIEIDNPTARAVPCTVLIPIPQHTPYQQPLQDPSASCAISLSWEPALLFRYAVWHTEIPARQKSECILTCPVRVLPQHASVRAARFDDYQRLEQALIERNTRSSEICDSRDERIVALSDELWQSAPRMDAYIRAVCDYCATHLSYGDPIRGLYTSRDALLRAKVDCGGFSTLALALLHARGIPARLVAGFFACARNEPMHVWIEILLPDGTTVPVDLSSDHLFRAGRDRTKSGRLGFVGSDHITVSRGCDLSFRIGDGTYHAPFFQYPLCISESAAYQPEPSYHVTIAEYAAP
ncbi:transglutaminase domain-containing protein [Candidatus Uhrbacteria bacterium]|nr:transglutaminase domain-containing protein [Candidatus Uhrbacteria bacterium]